VNVLFLLSLCLLTASIKLMKNSHHHDERKPSNTYAIPFILILIFAVVELLGGVWTHSLALLSDAWHMFSDVFALGLAWFAAHLSAKPGTHKHANGQSHAEIAAAAMNALLMLVVVAYIIFEALHRFKNPHTVSGGYVMLIAFVGLLVNMVVAKMLHGGHSHDRVIDHNKRAAYLHVISDLLGSVAALLAGTVIYLTGWQQIDPILSIFISALILFVTLKLIKDIWYAYKNG
jgi:cobalt-zinc-cadmium efflux system protein